MTYFVAFLAIDQKRIDDRRDGTLCWIKYGDRWQPNKFSQRSFLEEGFVALGNILCKAPVKVKKA